MSKIDDEMFKALVEATSKEFMSWFTLTVAKGVLESDAFDGKMILDMYLAYHAGCWKTENYGPDEQLWHSNDIEAETTH